MFPQPMSRPEFRPDDSHLDPARTLEQYLLAGFPPDLALDLVLNELVVRAAQATGASAAALALVRGEEMVCRAATGTLAPELGVPLNTRDGLSGACFQTRQPQLSLDTEVDPRVDPAVWRLGIRSILIVPVFDRADKEPNDKDSHDKNASAEVSGVLEAFSCSPAAFSDSDQKLLEDFAEECARIRRAAIELSQRSPAAPAVFPDIVLPEAASEVDPSAFVPTVFTPFDGIANGPLPTRRPAYESWTLVLGTLAILAALAVSLLIGYRIGWLRPSASLTGIAQPVPPEAAPARPCVGTAAPGCSAEPSSAPRPASQRAIPSSLARTPAKSSRQTTPTHPAAPAADELVVFEKGKVIFRMTPAPAAPDETKSQPVKPDSSTQAGDGIVEASSTTKIDTTKIPITKVAPSRRVWLSPAQAETRLLSRTEPQYPSEALAAHRAGSVVLEVQVAEDGSVSNIRTLSGDPALAAAAAEAVRNWRYQPYRRHDHPAQFQTDVTLSFALPN